MLASAIALTLYDYFLMFDDEVRCQSSGRSHQSPNPPFSKVRYIWRGRKTWGSSRYSYTRTERTDEHVATVFYLYILVRAPFPSSLRVPGGACHMASTESDPSRRVSVLGNLLCQWPEKLQGQSERETPLPRPVFWLNLYIDYVRDPPA